MTTRRATPHWRRCSVNTRWNHRPEPEPEPVSPLRAKALHLERPGPGIVVSVPLRLLPEYLEIYHLEPAGIQEPKVASRDGPGEAILLVTRAPADLPSKSSAGERIQKGGTL